MKNNIKFLVVKKNDVLHSNIDEHKELILEFVNSLDEVSSGSFVKEIFLGNLCKYRFRIFERQDKTFIFLSNSNVHIQSSRTFSSDVDYFLSFYEDHLKEIRKVEDKYNSALRLLTHNLTKYVAQSLQEIEFLVPQHEIVKRSWKDKVRYLNSVVQSDCNESAKTILKLAKHSQGMKTEISIYNKLLSASPNMKIERHNIHRVIMNSLYFFFPEFTDRGIEVVQEPSKLEAKFDYESFSVALYHIFENAAKYCKANSELVISTKEQGNTVLLNFKMKSLQILSYERNIIFTQGHRGSKAIQYEVEGNGVGMYVISEVIKLNKGFVEIFSEKNSLIMENDTPFETNILEVILPR